MKSRSKPEVVAYRHALQDPSCYNEMVVQVEPLIRLSDYEALQAECEQLRKGAELGRSILSKREPGKAYGCHCDLDEGMEPDGCVIDSGERHNCIYAKDILVKEQCEYWRVIATDATIQESNT